MNEVLLKLIMISNFIPGLLILPKNIRIIYLTLKNK